MTIHIEYVKIDKSETLTAYIEDKLSSIARKYEWLIKAQVYLKKANTHPTNNCTCEIVLSVPGQNLFATSSEKNFEMAVKETISDLSVQLKKRKAKFTKQNISS